MLRERTVYLAIREDDPVYQNATVLGVYTHKEDAEQRIADEIRDIRNGHDLMYAGQRGKYVVIFGAEDNAEDTDEAMWDVAFEVWEETLYEREEK